MPETVRFPFNVSQVITVPVVVKAYSCEMERVKKGVVEVLPYY